MGASPENADPPSREFQLEQSFGLGIPIADVWAILNDLVFLAECIPGCRLLNMDGELAHAAVNLRVGPVVLEFMGTATVIERDTERNRLVVSVEGKDVRGQGDVVGSIEATLCERALGETEVLVDSRLALSGFVAHLGQSVVERVAESLLTQFVERLEARLISMAANEEGRESPAPPTDISPGRISMSDLTSDTVRRAVVGVMGALLLVLIVQVRRLCRRAWKRRRRGRSTKVTPR